MYPIKSHKPQITSGASTYPRYGRCTWLYILLKKENNACCSNSVRLYPMLKVQLANVASRKPLHCTLETTQDAVVVILVEELEHILKIIW